METTEASSGIHTLEGDLTGDGGVIKTIIKHGQGPLVPKGAKPEVHYVGTLEDGTKFDSSRDRGNYFTFELGAGRVIKAWDLGIATMKVGEVCNLKCRGDYAYGESGSPPTIPANATLNFEVELFGWEDPEPDTTQEKIAAAAKRKEEGNALFKQGKYAEASKKYNKVLDYFKHSYGITEEEKKPVDEVKLASLLNLAACQVKLKENSDAVLSCHKALDIDNHNVKALFRRAQAYGQNSEFDLAKADLLEAIKLSPNSKEIRDELETLKKNMASSREKEKALFSKMFSSQPPKTDAPAPQ